MARRVTQTRLEITAEQAHQILEDLNEVRDQVSSLIAGVKAIIKQTGKASPTNSPKKETGKGNSGSPVAKEKAIIKQSASPVAKKKAIIKQTGEASPTNSPKKGTEKGKSVRPRKPAGNYVWSEMQQVWYDPKKGEPRC